MARPDIKGQRFGRLVAVERFGYPRLNSSWLVRCDCGKEFVERQGRLGHVRSCGCLKRDLISQRSRIHGESHGGGKASRLYTIWCQMRGRINSPSAAMFYRYGGRGISICREWQTYPAFRDWALANGYADSLTIERIDNDGNYEPANCRWATNAEQSRNKSNNIVLEYQGRMACLADHAEAAGQDYERARARIHRGWSIKDALEVPVIPTGAKLIERFKRDG